MILEPAAWIFELASWRDKSTGEYGGWRQMIQVSRPHVPTGSIRELRPLYAAEIGRLKGNDCLVAENAKLQAAERIEQIAWDKLVAENAKLRDLAADLIDLLDEMPVKHPQQNTRRNILRGQCKIFGINEQNMR